jgi:hypothetical protein
MLVRYLKNNTLTSDIAKIRFGKQGRGQMGGFCTIGEGFTVAFAGGNWADKVEIAKQSDANQPKTTSAGNVTVCIIFVCAGSEQASGGF